MAFSGVSGSTEEDFFTKTPILKNCSPELKSSCRTCAEASHSPFNTLIKSEYVQKSTKITKSQQLLKNSNLLLFCKELTLILVRIRTLCIFFFLERSPCFWVDRRKPSWAQVPISRVQNKVETGSSLHDSRMETTVLLEKKEQFSLEYIVSLSLHYIILWLYKN